MASSTLESRLAAQNLCITPAKVPDAATISSIVKAAYSKYIGRIGKPPAPMLTDYASLIVGTTGEEVYVLRSTLEAPAAPTSISTESTTNAEPGVDPTILGSIVVATNPDSPALKVNNLVVSPAAQGRGLGRVLMDFAKELARQRGLGLIELYTNVKMWENVGLYAKLGFVEVGRRVESGYERVFFEKRVDGV